MLRSCVLAVLLAALACVGLTAPPARATTVVVGGPTGARLSGISVNPAHPADLYVTGPDGAWSSLDADQSWQPAALPLWGVFAYDPANPDRVFAGGLGGTVLISNDSGQTWDHSPQ